MTTSTKARYEASLAGFGPVRLVSGAAQVAKGFDLAGVAERPARAQVALTQRAVLAELVGQVARHAEDADYDTIIAGVEAELEAVRTSLEEDFEAIESEQHTLATTYRGLHLLFTCSGEERVRLRLVDATGEELGCNGDSLADFAAPLPNGRYAFDPTTSPDVMVMPGWPGDTAAVHKIATVAHDKLAQVIVDAPQDLESPADLRHFMETEDANGLHGRPKEGSHVSIAANPLNVSPHPDRPFYVPTSWALAGNIIRQDLEYGIGQPAFGYRHSFIPAHGTAFDVIDTRDLEGANQSAIVALRGPGGTLQTWGCRTLCLPEEGSTWQYQVTRCRDRVAKDVLAFVNKYIGAPNSPQERNKLQSELASYFLKLCTGPGRLFDSAHCREVTRHPDEPAQIVIRADFEGRIATEQVAFHVQCTDGRGPELVDVQRTPA